MFITGVKLVILRIILFNLDFLINYEMNKIYVSVIINMKYFCFYLFTGYRRQYEEERLAICF